MRAVYGGEKSYMLKSHEEPWEMNLDEQVEELLGFGKGTNQVRDKTRVVTYKCPFNSAV